MSRLLDSVYGRLGKPAVFTPPAGEGRPVRVIDETRGRAVESARGNSWDVEPHARVRVAELPEPRGGVLEIAGIAWRVERAVPYLAPSGGVTEELDLTLSREPTP